MITEFHKYYSGRKKLAASSMVLSYNSGQSRILICLVGYLGIEFMGILLPKVVMSVSNISKE